MSNAKPSYSFIHSLRRKSKEHNMQPLEYTTEDGPRFSLDSKRPFNNNEKVYNTPLSLMKHPRRPSRSSSLSSLDKLRRQERKNSKDEKISTEKRNTFTESIKSDVSEYNDHEPSIESFSGIERPGSFAAVCKYQPANEKQNNLFHALFKSVPQTDMLIEVYKCALHKDILLQGHVYISEHHVCFKANIFGWVTNLVIHFDEITAVEKKMTAKVIPNGIVIVTPTSRHVFASFILRDQAYDQIVKIWKLHKRISSSSSYTSFEEDKQVSTIDHSVHSNDSAIMPNVPPLLLTDEVLTKQDISQPSTSDNKPAALLKVKDTSVVLNNRPRSVSDSYAIKMMSSPSVPSNKPRCERFHSESRYLTRAVRCPCMKHDEQYGYVALDRIYPGTVEAMDKLFYQTDFIKCFLECCENFEDVQLDRWKNNSRNINGKRKIKASEKRTKTIMTLFHEKREHHQLPYYSCVTAKKSMPDMPMGAVYCIQSRTCITRVGKQKVRVLITFEVAFKKSGLVSSVIENNAADDQFRQYSHLASVLSSPSLANELIKDKELLKTLHLTPRRYLRNPAGWLDKPYLLQLLTFIAFLLVIISQCVLTVRVSDINSRFSELQRYMRQQGLQSGYDGQQTGPFDVELHLNMAYDRLEELKEKMKEYDKHISVLKNNVK